MKVLFLDIDGVLNSSEYFFSKGYLDETESMTDAETMLLAHPSHLDPSALQVINHIVKESGAQVVLSSSWRMKYTIEEWTEMMQKRGATFKITGRTPKHSMSTTRGAEILDYINSMRNKPDSIVIIDDHSDMDNLKKYLVLTNGKFGITMRDAEKALQLLFQ
jgi:hypothetical protein